MIGETVPSTVTSSWIVALRDAGLVFVATVVASIAATQPQSWADFFAFEHVGVPILAGLQVFVYSLIYNYKVTMPPTPAPPNQ